MIVVRAGMGIGTNSIEDTVSRYQAITTETRNLEGGLYVVT